MFINGFSMNGMTGYSYKEFYVDDTYISTEIKTVNHRFLDINIHLPAFLNSFEIGIRELISGSFVRGKIDVNVFIRLKGVTGSVEPNIELAKNYYNSLKAIALECGMSPEIKLEHLIKYDDIMICDTNKDYSVFFEDIKKSLSENVREVNKMRALEGEATQKNVISILDKISADTGFISSLLPEMEASYFNIINTKMTELLGDKIDNDRLLNEVGILVSRSCINEELERLKHHIEQFRKIIFEGCDVGKRLDFICQEMHREINTLGSKASLAQITAFVVNVKNGIEKIREQIRNIE